MAVQAYVKISEYFDLLKMAKNEEIDKLYKTLMILKLWKELQIGILPTKEEGEAANKNLAYVTELILFADKLKST